MKKKWIMFFCCFCFILNTLTISTFAATSKTSSEALSWIASYKGKTIGSGQCVALITAYYNHLGFDSVSGNACDYATNTIPVGLGWREKGGTPQPGDILIYTGSTYGHVAIYESDNISWHQNWSGQYVQEVSRNYKQSFSYQGKTNTYWGCIHINFATSSLQTFQITFDGNGGTVDTSPKARYDTTLVNVARGADQLVIYDQGGSKTGTNIYGTEIIVDSNYKVIDKAYGVGNATIPSGGFVASGHGAASVWLDDNVNIGDYCFYNYGQQILRVWTQNSWMAFWKYIPNNSPYGTLPIPNERDGYVFEGWYTSPTGGSKITSTTTFTANSNQTLYAHWLSDINTKFHENNAIAYNNHLYVIFDDLYSWNDAKNYCEALGGHLATITSEQEQLIVISLLKGKASVWLGATDEATEGSWKWITGENFNYTNWEHLQPDNSKGVEHYLSQLNDAYDYVWRDVSNNATRGFICEFENIPSYTSSTVTKNNTTHTIKTTLYNVDQSKVFAAGYKNKKLTAFDVKTYNSEDLTFTLNGTFDTIKVMVFDSLTGLKPFCTEEVIPSSKWE